MLRSISVQVFPRLVSTPPSCASRNASRWLGARGYIMSEGDRSAEQLTLPKHETHKHTRVHIQTHKQTHTHTQSHTHSHTNACITLVPTCTHLHRFLYNKLQDVNGNTRVIVRIRPVLEEEANSKDRCVCARAIINTIFLDALAPYLWCTLC